MDESPTSPESNRGYKREVNMQAKVISQLDLLEQIYSILNSIGPVSDPDAFEYLGGIRDQAARIMRDAIDSEENV
jgi:hypothetical protein